MASSKPNNSVTRQAERDRKQGLLQSQLDNMPAGLKAELDRRKVGKSEQIAREIMHRGLQVTHQDMESWLKEVVFPVAHRKVLASCATGFTL